MFCSSKSNIAAFLISFIIITSLASRSTVNACQCTRCLRMRKGSIQWYYCCRYCITTGKRSLLLEEEKVDNKNYAIAAADEHSSPAFHLYIISNRERKYDAIKK